MNGKWLILIVGIWITAVFLGSTFDGATSWAGSGTAGYEEAPQNTLSYLMNVKNSVQRLETGIGSFPLPMPNGEYFDRLFKVVTLQFTFMSSTYMLFYWIVLLPIALAGILCLILLVIGIAQGNISWS